MIGEFQIHPKPYWTSNSVKIESYRVLKDKFARSVGREFWVLIQIETPDSLPRTCRRFSENL